MIQILGQPDRCLPREVDRFQQPRLSYLRGSWGPTTPNGTNRTAHCTTGGRVYRARPASLAFRTNVQGKPVKNSICNKCGSGLCPINAGSNRSVLWEPRSPRGQIAQHERPKTKHGFGLLGFNRQPNYRTWKRSPHTEHFLYSAFEKSKFSNS